jgi:MoaA/NifB/PqqE/SkfB family radical SAM enzyme
MRFNIHLTKTGIFFHFLMNLTEFHHSCRKQDNKQWLFITGELTKKEKESLKEFKKLLRNYGYQGENFLGIPFITSGEKEIWKKVKKWVKPDEFTKIKNIFKIFTPQI